MGEIQIIPVAAAEFIRRWENIEPMLDKAMPVILRRYEPIDILAMLITGACQGWLILEDDHLLAVLVTQVINFPRRRCCSVFCLSGTKINEWFARANQVITEYARKMGADHMEVQGRRGWERYLDMEPTSVFLVKAIPAEGGIVEK